MSSFNVGDKCVAVCNHFELKKGNMYTIEAFLQCRCGNINVKLYEISPNIHTGTTCGKCGLVSDGIRLFALHRIRPLDHAFADEVEKQIKESLITEKL
jgi:hypothetical protein